MPLDSIGCHAAHLAVIMAGRWQVADDDVANMRLMEYLMCTALLLYLGFPMIASCMAAAHMLDPMLY